MAHIRLDDKRIELSAGEPRIGTGGEAQVRFGGGPEVAGRQVRFLDDRKARSTVLMPILGTAAAPMLVYPCCWKHASTADPQCPTASRNDAVVSGETGTLQTLETVSDGSSWRMVLPIPAAVAHIGRGEHDDVIVADDSVSVSDASIQRRESGWVVEDMNWTSGTFISGERARGVQTPKPNPAVHFGGVKVIFRSESEIADAEAGTRVFIGFKPSDQQRAPLARRIVANRQATRVIPHGRRATRRSSESRPQWSSARTVLLVIQDR